MTCFAPVRLDAALTVLLALLAVHPANAQDATTWKPVPRGMSALLDEGWRIESVAHNQVFKRERESATFGNSLQEIAGVLAIASVPDGNEYNFLLSKGGKWVVCVLSSPRPDAAFSRCRALN